MRLRDCKNVYVSGSLLFCCNCRRVIGYVSGIGIYALKDVRLLYFVPIDKTVSDKEQVVLFRILEHGPLKRKSDKVELCDEPPYKKLKFDNTHSVIVMRARVERDEPLYLPAEVDQAVFIPPDDMIYDSSDEIESLSELEADFEDLEDYGSSSDFGSEFENDRELFSSTETLIDVADDLVTLRSPDGVVTHLYWVSSPILYFETYDNSEPLDLSMRSGMYAIFQ